MSKESERSKFERSKIRLAEKGQTTLLDTIERVKMDGEGRLHSLETPAIEWADDSKAHFIEGVWFDPWTWEAIVTGKITPAEAVHLTNAEQRRVAIKRIGVNRMLESLHGLCIDVWKDYALYELELYDDVELRYAVSWRTGRTSKTARRIYLPAKFLKMKDSTTGQIYYLRVPSDALTCETALAWTFAMDRGETRYAPEAET